MKNNKRLRLPILIVAIVVIIILIVNISKKNDNTPSADTNSTEDKNAVIETETLAEVKKYNNLEISNVRVEIKDDMTIVRADIRNGTNKKINEQLFNINLLDKDGKVITSLAGYADNLEPGESTPLRSSIATTPRDSETCNVEFTAKMEPVPQETTPTPDANADTNNTNTENND